MILFLVCLAYALIVPRLKKYAYILLLVPTYHGITTQAKGRGHCFLYVLAIL